MHLVPYDYEGPLSRTRDYISPIQSSHALFAIRLLVELLCLNLVSSTLYETLLSKLYIVRQFPID